MLGLSTEKTESPKGLLSNLLGLKTGVKDDKFSLLLKSFSFGKSDEKGLGKEFHLLGDDKLNKGLKKLDALLQIDEKAQAKQTESGSSLSKLFALGKEDLKDEEHIHSDIVKALPARDMKQTLQSLIGEAKDYLKDQIAKKVDLQEMPKTLGGLIKLAEKSGIDVRAISFESLPKTPLTEELAQSLQLTKPTQLAGQTGLPHSTSQLVKPTVINKNDKDIEGSKPLNALLNRSVLAEESLLEQSFALEKTAKANPLSATLSSLLHGENGESVQENEGRIGIEGEKGSEKSQLVQQGKTEQLSAKINEAKQLVQHVAQNLKESVENYKPPFTRIKMQLNPQKFGEMDVTLIQRGNNVHININANTTALTVMMQNAHELKNQLASQGLGDASMNFSSHQQQQHEDQRKQENAQFTYEEYQEYEEEFTEVATALEVVVPRYI